MLGCISSRPSAQVGLGAGLGLGRVSDGGLGVSSCALHTGPWEERGCWAKLGNTGGTAPAVGNLEGEVGCTTPQQELIILLARGVLPAAVENLPMSHLATLGQAFSCLVLLFLLLGKGTNAASLPSTGLWEQLPKNL